MTIHATPGQPPLRAGDQTQTAAELQEIWDTDPRWDGIERTYTAEDVIAPARLGARGVDARPRGAENLWNLLHTEDYIRALGAYTGGQAVQQVRAGLKAIYLSRLAGRGRRQPRRADLPRPEPLPRQLGAGGRAPHQQRAAPPGPDRARRGRASRRTGSRRSSRTPRPASADRSTPTSSRSR